MMPPDIETGPLKKVSVGEVSEAAPGLQDATYLFADVPLKDVNQMAVNYAFIRRACRTLSLGWRNPLVAPRLWMIITISFAAQLGGSYLLQSKLYILATGIDNSYPGLSGCLTNGCGRCQKGSEIVTCTQPTMGKIPQQPLVDQINLYYTDFTWMFAVSMVLLMTMSFTGDIITSIMRFNAAESIHEKIMVNKMLYRLTVDGTLDNLDQRITSDLQVVLDGFCCVLFGNSADYLAYPVAFCVGRFTYALSNLYVLSPIPDPVVRGNIIGVILVAVAVAIVAYIIPVNHVAKVFFRGQKYEGDFRTTHTRAVLNCEQISTLHGESAEKDLANKQYMRWDYNTRVYYTWQSVLMILRLFVTICINAVAYISLAVSGVRNNTTGNFFQKQAGDVLEYLLYFPVFCERLAYACGAAHRVGQLLEHVDFLEANPLRMNIEYDPARVALIDMNANPPPVLPSDKKRSGCGCCSRVQVKEQETVLKRTLFKSVDLEVLRGESLCIVGPSGCGKSSLLRIIGGLWEIEDGTVVRPKDVGTKGIFFLPQRAYVFPGSLKAQILYPLPETAAAHLEEVETMIQLCRLQHLYDRYGLDSPQNWPALLSISEMQCLGFARMLYHKPAFCLADECTSALDLPMESFLYNKCAEMGISMISVAHRPTVIPHHTHVFVYSASTHRWTKVPAAQVATCGKFPADGCESVQADDYIPEPVTEATEDGCGRLFLRRFGKALRLGVPSLCSPGALYLLTQHILCMGLYATMIIVIFRYYGTSIIIAKITGTNGYSVDVDGALNWAGVIIGMNAVSSVVQSLSAFLGAWLAIKIQRAIITHFHNKYFSYGVVYHVNRVMEEKGIDQRMVQDLGGFRESLGWLLGNPFCYCNFRVGVFPLGFVWLCLLGYSFSTGSWQLSLFMLIFMVSSYLWQIASSYLTAPAIERRQQAEGELRGLLGRVLQNVESVTFFGGELQERASADNLLQEVFKRRLEYNYLANLTSVPTITQYYWLQTGIYLMAAVVQVQWAPGVIPSTDLITNINFNIQWSKVSELIMVCLGGLGMVIGFTHRVMRVVEKVEEAEQKVTETLAQVSLVPDRICFENVTIAVPGSAQHLITVNLTATLPPSLWVTGHGKSSMLRTLAGMWPATHGTVSRPPVGKDGIIFIPQENYATQGTLAAQVVYPMLESDAHISDSELWRILDAVGLEEIAERWGLHKVVNWDMASALWSGLPQAQTTRCCQVASASAWALRASCSTSRSLPSSMRQPVLWIWRMRANACWH